VRAAADDAADSVFAAWKRAGLWDRVKSLPASASDRVEALLVRVVRAALDDPVPVHTAAEVMDHLERDGHAPAFGGALLIAVVARSRRILKVGGRAVPVALVAKFGTDLVTSFRLGAYELELLASLVVNRFRAAGLPVDPVTVQRITVNAYVRPGRHPRHRGTQRERGADAGGDVGGADPGGRARAGPPAQGGRAGRGARPAAGLHDPLSASGQTRGSTWST